ncbi:tRNA lysidine(34) synthetase TilS [Sphingomonas baiyangensis]|uniref:tRNA lysidine(34) synthetase TilS n=1 Tax=Sphingomonas baiyangensis TaxID=2572576 RepID=UPI00201608F4|nr:tRNA lysidine(34) synthetase TilS [Sphingomonas baiyangensis]
MDELFAPPPEAEGRFRRHLIAALGFSLGHSDVIGLAVSGGPDSMALLTLTAAVLPGRCMAATVDHRLREGSADEAAMVARHCAAIGVPHIILTPDHPIIGSSLQARAREVRYRLLAHWAAAAQLRAVATAHHLDDQAETFLLRAGRGSGISGLAGIRVRQHIDDMLVVRPLLGWRREALAELVRDVPHVHDPSNANERFDRTRVRRVLAPDGPIDVGGVARSAAILAQTDDDLRALIAMLWDERASSPSPGIVDLRIDRLPYQARRNLTQRALATVRAEAGIASPGFGEATSIEPLLARLALGETATQAGVIIKVRARATWRFSPAPPRRAH